MKVISNKVKPSVEFGDKVRLLADSDNDDLYRGVIGVVISENDSDGDVKVHNGSDWDYVSLANLEVLQKFSGDAVTPADKSVVIELTADEVGFIEAMLTKYSYGALQREFFKLIAEVA